MGSQRDRAREREREREIESDIEERGERKDRYMVRGKEKERE